MNAILKIATLTSVCAATVALAQPTSTPASVTKIGPSNEAKQIVCVRQTEIGSRLRTRRVCRTRAEWEEHRLQVRGEIDTVLHPTIAG